MTDSIILTGVHLSKIVVHMNKAADSMEKIAKSFERIAAVAEKIGDATTNESSALHTIHELTIKVLKAQLTQLALLEQEAKDQP